MLTGGEFDNKNSVAPLISNTVDVDYGKLVDLLGDVHIRTHSFILHNDGKEIFQSWTNEYDKIRVDCGDESIHVYLHENYRNSTPENIGDLVLKWMEKQEEEL